MTALLRAEVRKLTGTRLAWGLLLGAVGIVVLALGIALWVPDAQGVQVEGAPPGVATVEDVRDLLGVVGIVAVFSLLLGVTIATNEFRHDTAATSFLVEPRRSRVLVAKAVVAVGAGAVYALVALVAAMLLLVVAATVDGGTLPLDASIGWYAGMTVLASAANGGLGLGVGAAVRSQVAGIVGVLVWLFVVESLVAGLLPDVARWTPFAAGGAMTVPTAEMGRGLATTVALGWVALALGVGGWLTERRDVV